MQCRSKRLTLFGYTGMNPWHDFSVIGVAIMRGTAAMNDELLKAIRLVLREELGKWEFTRPQVEAIRLIVREELDKEREFTTAQLNKFKLEMRFRLKHITEVLTDHEKRLADHDARFTNIDRRLNQVEDEPKDDGDGDGNGRAG